MQNKNVFISYRREGGDFLAHLIYDRLERDGYSVFLDVESLRSGEFNHKLLEIIENATDFLIVLPPHGLDRCKDENDWVRLEIEHAIKTEKNIIPMIMRNFVFPEDLPESILQIKNLNGITADSEFFDSVIDKLETRFLMSKPENAEEEPVSDFQKQQILKCHNLIKDYLRSDNVEFEEEYNKFFLELVDMKPFIPEIIYEQIIGFVKEHVEPITENYFELFREPMIKRGYGKMNDEGVFEIKDGCAEKVIIHFYGVLLEIEEKFNTFTKNVLTPVLK